MSVNTNPPRQPVFAPCQENDPRRAGAVWDINNEDRRLSTQNTWLLQPFFYNVRDENGKRTRPTTSLTDEQAAFFTNVYGIELEKKEGSKDGWHLLSPIRFKNWFSLT